MKPCRSASCRLLLGLLCPAVLIAQDGATPWTDTPRPAMDGTTTVTGASPCFEPHDSEDNKQRENDAVAKLPRIARFWLTEDVVYIISREERCAFLHLATDLDRDHFIELFWSRRAPDPESLDNSFKQEHYRRIVFANERFGTEIPGWKTDRGRVYVTFGPPDSIESHRSGEKTRRPPKQGVEAYQYPWEEWHYGHVEGVGENVDLEFADPNESGDYRLTMPPEIKDELIFVPPYNVGGFSRKGVSPEPAQSFVMYVGPAPTPLVQFKDLEAMVVSRIIRDQVYFRHRIEFAKATDATTFARILIYIPVEQQSSTKNNGNSLTGFEVFGRISKLSGWVVETFERSISLDGQRNLGLPDPSCQFNVAIAPGTYRLAIVVKNMFNGETGAL